MWKMPNARKTRADNQKTIYSLKGVSVERNESPPKTTAAAMPYSTGFNPFPENALANLFTDANNTNAPAKKAPI
jgi:hypothetical protein